MTMGQVAKHFGVSILQARRTIERGFAPHSIAPRVGRWRFLNTQDLPRFEKALRDAGYLKRRPVAKPDQEPAPAPQPAREPEPANT
jgi:hypothetical protein